MTKREMFGSPPALVAFAIMIVVSLLATLGTHPLAMIMVAGIAVVLAMITIDSGGHSMLVFSGAFLLFDLALAFEQLRLEGAVAWAGAGLVVLIYADAIRLCFALRRHGVIETAVYQGVFVGTGIVALCTMGTAALVAGLGNVGGNANWLLVPLALTLAVIGLVGLAIAVSKSPGEFDKRRWKPGERLTAPPRAATDDPSLKTSVPPAPPPPTAPPPTRG